jgi:predicted DNA-binding transcriptional regulator AlpA
MTTQQIKILNSEQAAELFGFHRERFLGMVKRLGIPGKKIGRCWRFVDIDLLEWIRSSYAGAESASNERRKTGCRKSTNALTANCGGRKSNDQTAAEYDNLLGLNRKPTRKPGRGNLKLIYGSKPD